MKNSDFISVKKLIEMLKQLPKDTPVLVNGYESGFDKFYKPNMQKLKYMPENPYWDGEYQQPDADDEAVDLIEAVVLQRVVRNV